LSSPSAEHRCARGCAKTARRFSRQAVDATLTFRNAHPVIKDARVGRKLNETRLTERIVSTLHANSRLPVRVRTRTIAPQVPAGSFAASIVINRSINRLYLFDGTRLRRTFAVATGQSIYPTPRGRWQIVVKWKNPWYRTPGRRASSPCHPARRTRSAHAGWG